MFGRKLAKDNTTATAGNGATDNGTAGNRATDNGTATVTAEQTKSNINLAKDDTDMMDDMDLDNNEVYIPESDIDIQSTETMTTAETTETTETTEQFEQSTATVDQPEPEQFEQHLDSVEHLNTVDNTSNVGDEQTEETEKPRDLILYIIIDKANPAMLQYYRECGVNVSKIFTNINDAKDTLLMQVDPVKILIIDTGTGRFSAMGSRKELLDLMGICDEDARISVFLTDTVIKSEVEYNESFETKKIHWYKFKSNTDVIAKLLQARDKENYIYDENDKDTVDDIPDNVLQFKGFKAKVDDGINIGAPTIDIFDIKVHMAENTDNSDEIPGYEIKV